MEFHPDPARKLSANLCLKHVEFHSKNKFEKLVHLGFIIRNYHNARSSECQTVSVLRVLRMLVQSSAKDRATPQHTLYIFNAGIRKCPKKFLPW